MSLEIYAHAHAKTKHQTIIQYLGKGHFGEAYLTSENTVLKITKDHCETLAALMMIGHQHENVVDIYDVQKLPDEHFIIEQEYLNHNSDADALFWELSDVADTSGYTLPELIKQDPVDIGEFASNELTKIICQLRAAMGHLNGLGIQGEAIDLASDNFTINNGHIKVFDNRFDDISKLKALDKIKQEYPQLYAQHQENQHSADY